MQWSSLKLNLPFCFVFNKDQWIFAKCKAFKFSINNLIKNF